MSRKRKSDYFEPGDRIADAIDAILSVKSSFIGDRIQARMLILALCDQTGASIEAQRAVAALLFMSDAQQPSVLQKTCRLNTSEKES